MDAQTVRTALGTLQTNPYSEAAWKDLESTLSEAGGDASAHEVLTLLDAARLRHSGRGETEPALRLLELGENLASDVSIKANLRLERAKLLVGENFEGNAARELLRKTESDFGANDEISSFLAELDAKAERWPEQAQTYLAEVESATDDAYQSAMLMRAAEAELCFAKEPKTTGIIDNLERAVRLDSGNVLAARMLEAIYRKKERYEDEARVLERVLERGPEPEIRASAGVRRARVLLFRLADEARAAAAYDRVLEGSPSHPDALEFVTEYYSKTERWDDLVRAFERPLRGATSDVEKLGELLQVAMLHYRMRAQLADAEPWFARIRKVDPAHEGMLAFYRDYKAQLGDDAGLVQVLQDAQRALPAGDPRAAEISNELLRFAESQANAHRAIEQYKAVLRGDPDNADARQKLKILYKQTQGHNALVELLRQELDRTKEEDLEGRLVILREIASIYREYMKSETALVGVLNQIVQLDGKLDANDVGEVRELVFLYERLGRHRDLLAAKKLLAEIVPDLEEKKALYRQSGRLWLDQFSNVQQAMESYAALHAIDSSDPEALERLDELYRKRRAWKELFALYEEQLTKKEGVERVPVLRELALLLSERLNRGDDALVLYKEIVELDPTRVDALDRMEKLAERSKNWEVLADSLERRLGTMPEDETRLPVLTKLGQVYAEHLEDAEKSIDTFRRVVQIQPGNARAMRVLRDAYLKGARYDELEDLYASQNDLEGLAEVFSTAADRATESAAKLELSYRAARVYEERLGAAPRAIRSYERILGLDPKDRRAIERLLPLYEADEKWARVPLLLETLVELSTDPAEKVGFLANLTDVAGTKLGDRRAAVVHAKRAFEVAPTDDRAIGLLDSASRAAGVWDDMLGALEARVSEIAVPLPEPPPKAETKGRGKKGKKKAVEEPAPSAASSARPKPTQEERALGLRIARVLGEELGRVTEAMEKLRSLGESFPNDDEILRLFESLLGRQQRPEDVRWLYEHRATHEAEAESRARILCDYGAFEEQQAKGELEVAIERALPLYERAWEEHEDYVPALEAVARVALSGHKDELACRAIEAHRDLLQGVERGKKEVVLASLYAERLGRARDALASAERALSEQVEPGLVIPVLQKLVEVPEVRGEAARLLSEQYQAGGNARQEADALRALISETKDASEQISLYERLAGIYEEKLGELGSALLALLEAIRKHPTEMHLWDKAEQLARASGRTVELADTYREVLRLELEAEVQVDLCRRAAALSEGALGDASSAVPYYEKILALVPDDEEAFARLKEILTSEERWSELEELYDREIARLEDEGRRIEMLAEVALLTEDIMGDAERAAAYHRRILALDPVAQVSLESLDRLLTRLGKVEELADLLEKRIELAMGEGKHQLLVRLGQLALSLHQPERSSSAIEQVLNEVPTNYEARDVAEELLKIGSVKVRAARALEAVYETRDEIRDLVRVLGVRVEGLRPVEGEKLSKVEQQDREDERRDLLRRIATLRNDRLHDDEGSFDVFAELAPLDPLDVDLRERLVDAGRRLGRNAKVVSVLVEAAEAADVPAVRGEILMQAAKVQSDVLEDVAGAEKSLRAVAELREDEPDLAIKALRLLEQIITDAGRHEDLAENLSLQIELETDFDRKNKLLGTLAIHAADVLGDRKRSIAAWEARLVESSDDSEALAALTDLYEKESQPKDLARVLAVRRDVASGDKERIALSRRLARVQEELLGDSELAIESYQALESELGSDPEVLDALARLFEKTERHRDLADTFQKQADTLDDESARLLAWAKLGRVFADHLGDVHGALDAYRHALSIDTKQVESRKALTALLSNEDASVRLEAADILAPIYETEGDFEASASVLEVETKSTDDPAQTRDKLKRLVELSEGPLSDPARAMGYALRGAKLASEEGDLGEWFEILERLAVRSSSEKAEAELLEAIAKDLFDPGAQVTVLSRAAEIHRTVTGDEAHATAIYEKCLEISGEDTSVLLALEELYRKAGRHEDLLKIYGRREEIAADDRERKTLLFKRAELLDGALARKDDAISAYEAILEIDSDSDAISAVSSLYAARGRYEDLANLLERRIDSEPASALKLRVELAELFEGKLEQPERALDEVENVLLVDSQNADAIRFAERLVEKLDEPAHRARAASMLEPVYMVRSDYDRVLGALSVRLAGSEDPMDRRDLFTRIASIHEEQREDYRAALEVTAELLADDPTDALTVSEMERLAKVASAEERLAELFAAQVEKLTQDDDNVAGMCKRAGEIFLQKSRPKDALPLLKRALAFAPDDAEVFGMLDQSLIAVGTAAERIELYRAGIEHRYDPAERGAMFHTIAELSEKLDASSDAIGAYQEALAADEGDLKAAEALTRLLRKEKRFEELAELFLRQAESVSPGDAAPFRLALAQVYENELSRPDAALDQLQEIVSVLPNHAEAISRIEAYRSHESLKERAVEILRPLYEAFDDWKRIIRLNEDRFAIATDPHERVDILRETAELWERRGDDHLKARQVLGEAFRLVPDDDDLRAEVERLTMITEEWKELADLYEQTLATHPDLGSKNEILRRLAEVFDERLDDPRAALGYYAKLFDEDPSDGDVVFSTHRLALLLAEWPIFERAIEAKVDIVYDEDERLGSLLRLGDLRWYSLEKPEEATEAYERAFELSPESDVAIDRLIEVYETRARHDRLVEIYQAKIDHSETSEDEKYDLLTKQAKVFEKELSDKTRAVEALQNALLSRPGDAPVVAELNRLYRELEMWPDLLDNLRLDASTADSLEARLAIRHEIARILAEKMGAPDEALETYGTILEEKPDDVKAADLALELADREEHLRREAADLLIPALRPTNLKSHLIRALELLVTAETEGGTRADLLAQISGIYETDLKDGAKAFDAALRAMHEAPEDSVKLGEAERLGDATGKAAEFAKELQKRAEETYEPDLARGLWVRLAAFVEAKLGDKKKAVFAYEKACEQTGDQLALLEELDRIQSELGNTKEVIALLDRRMGLADSDEAQSKLLARQAELTLGDGKTTDAIGLLRQALERDLTSDLASSLLEKILETPKFFDEVFEILDGVYRDRPDGAKLAALHKGRLARAKSAADKLEMRRSLAQVLEEECKDPLAAQRVLTDGLADDVSDAGLVDEIERLLPVTGEAKEAATKLLSATRAAKNAAPDLLADLSVRAATWFREKASDLVSARVALEAAHGFAPENEDILEQLEGLSLEPGQEALLLGILEKRAALAGDDGSRIEFLKRSVELAKKLEKRDTAEKHLRAILAIDEQDLESLEALTHLRKAASDAKETFELLVRRAELEADFDKIRVLRLEAAEIAREKLDKVDSAIEILEALAENDPDDEEVSRQLRSAYDVGGRHADLAKLIERQMEGASGTLMLELKTGLAKLTLERLKDEKRATELLEEVFAEDPSLQDASDILAELYASSGAFEELASLYERRAEILESGHEPEALLQELRTLAKLVETKLSDLPRAAGIWERILEQDDSLQVREKLLSLSRDAGDKEKAAVWLLSIAERLSGAERSARYLELSTLRGELGQSDESLRAIEEALAADPKAETRKLLKAAYEKAGAFENLADIVVGEAENAPDVATKVKLLKEASAIHIGRRGDHGKGAELLARASELVPDDRAILLELCDAYSNSGRGADAVSVLERIVESYGGKRAKELGEIHRRLATAYLSQGNAPRALEELDKAFRIEPGNVFVLKQLGEVAMTTGDHKKAMQMYRALLLQKLGDGSPITKAEVFFKLGQVHQALGEVPNAKQMFDRASKEDPTLTAAKDALASL